MSEGLRGAHEAHLLNRLERGRPLTDDEIACVLADHQTALRHATASIGIEIADQLRDRLAAAPAPAGEGLRDRIDELVQDIGGGIDGEPYLDNAGWKRAHAALKELAALAAAQAGRLAAIDPEPALREALERLLDAWNRRHIAPEWMTLMGIAAQKADAALAALAAYEQGGKSDE